VEPLRAAGLSLDFTEKFNAVFLEEAFPFVNIRDFKAADWTSSEMLVTLLFCSEQLNAASVWSAERDESFCLVTDRQTQNIREEVFHLIE
jgi:hypothetical protein